MPSPTRPTRRDDDLPDLPPLDGEEGDEPSRDDVDLDVDDSPASLDDAAADDLPLDDLVDDLLDGGIGADDDEAGDDVVADLADEIDEDDGASWSGDDALPDVDLGGDLDGDEGQLLTDRGEEGPEGDALDDLGELSPIDRDAALDEPVDDLDVAEVTDAAAPTAAFALPEAGAVRVRRLATPAVVLAAARGARRLLGAGEGVVAASLDALEDADAGFEALGGPDDELLSSIAEDAAGVLYAGTFLGGVYRALPDGTAWSRVASLAEGNREPGPVDVVAEDRRVWARSRDGALFRSEDGAWFEGPLLAEPARGLARDAAGLVVVVGSRGRAALQHTSDGGRTWATVALPEGSAPWLVARSGDVWVVAQGAGPGPGYVSVDGGARWTRWEALAGATALCLVETDDGVARVLYAVYDDAADRAALVDAALGAGGEAVGARRVAALAAGLFPRGDQDAEARVDALVPLDRAGRRVVAVTPRGVALVER